MASAITTTQFWLATLLVLCPTAYIAYLFARGSSGFRPRLGSLGAARLRAIGRGGVFAYAEPAVRFLASRLAPLPVAPLRQLVTQRIEKTGNWLGLTADEFLALSILSGLVAGLVGTLLASLLGFGAVMVVGAVLLGLLLPLVELDGAQARRFLAINRGLPAAIDLAALCVGAGLDFPSAIRHAAQNMPTDDSLRLELQHMLREISLGHPRKRALESFAERAPTPAVRDFVAAVVQAEEKGTPLAEVLRVQGRVLRMRRSVMAEEAAARAGVMMMLPLLMIFCCVFLLLLGPFIVNMLESGF